MQGKVRLFGHPVHPMIIVFPLGLLGGALIFDIIHLYDRDGGWATISYYLIPVGLVTGVLAALTGFIEWLGIPSDTRAKRVGIFHALTNSAMMALFAVSWWLRSDAPGDPAPIDMAFSFAGGALSALGGWFGGELIYRMGMGVDADANLNAPPKT